MITICLTGKKGVGKSTLINEIRDLQDLKIKAFITDEFILETYKKNQAGYNLINEEFGDTFNDANGIDKKKLGDCIFKSKKNYNKLTKITNRLIKAWIEEKIIENINCDILIIELGIYLKFEKFYRSLFDKIISIKSKENYQDNHVSDFLDNHKIVSDFEIKKFDNLGTKKIIDWIKNFLFNNED